MSWLRWSDVMWGGVLPDIALVRLEGVTSTVRRDPATHARTGGEGSRVPGSHSPAADRRCEREPGPPSHDRTPCGFDEVPSRKRVEALELDDEASGDGPRGHLRQDRQLFPDSCRARQAHARGGGVAHAKRDRIAAGFAFARAHHGEIAAWSEALDDRGGVEAVGSAHQLIASIVQEQKIRTDAAVQSEARVARCAHSEAVASTTSALRAARCPRRIWPFRSGTPGARSSDSVRRRET